MNRTLYTFLSFLFLSFPNSSYCQWNKNGLVGISNQYVGITQTVLNDKPVIQADFNIINKDETYADIFGTFGVENRKGNEIDISIGTRKKFGQLTVNLEGGAYVILNPRLTILAPILRLEHQTGLFVGLEGRTAPNQNGYHSVLGYKGKWWNVDVRKIKFYGDDLTVARLNISHKIADTVTISTTIATPISRSTKDSSIVFNVSKSF